MKVNPFIPSYLSLYASGELAQRAAELKAMLGSCTICPHHCGNNRLMDEISRCYSGLRPIVSSYCLHFGEEPVLGGTKGVGNIFFGNCNLRCVYCQNFQISQNWKEERKHETSIERLAHIMLELQANGASAIGFVSPTHFVPQIVHGVMLAIDRGLRLPLIYNTNAYDSVEILRLLDGVFDIYLPDMKYGNDAYAYAYSKIPSYTSVSRAAVLEMFRQVGHELVYGDDGLVKRGLIIRHLVLPNDLASSEEVLRWISRNLDRRIALSIMAQYYPVHKAKSLELLNRSTTSNEYAKVVGLLEKFGFENGWTQESESTEYYRPEFTDRLEPFLR